MAFALFHRLHEIRVLLGDCLLGVRASALCELRCSSAPHPRRFRGRQHSRRIPRRSHGKVRHQLAVGSRSKRYLRSKVWPSSDRSSSRCSRTVQRKREDRLRSHRHKYRRIPNRTCSRRYRQPQ